MRFCDYKCRSCNYVKEFFESSSKASEPHLCNKCGEEMKRVYAAAYLKIGKNMNSTMRKQVWNSEDPSDKLKLTF